MDKILDSKSSRKISDTLHKSSKIKLETDKKDRRSKLMTIIESIKYKCNKDKDFKHDMMNANKAIRIQIGKGNGIGYTRIMVENKERTIPELEKLGYNITELVSYQGKPMIDIRW